MIPYIVTYIQIKIVSKHLHDKRSAHLFLVNSRLSPLSSLINKFLGNQLVFKFTALTNPAHFDLILLLASFLMSQSQTK